SALTARTREGEVLGHFTLFRNRDLGRLRAEAFMPGFDDVFAFRKAFDAEFAVGAGHCNEGVIKHGAVSAYPGVDVALYGHDVFRLVEGKGRFLYLLGHRPVKFAVDLRQGMDVVQRAVGIEHLYRLAGTHAEDVRRIDATLLIDYHGFFRHGPLAFAQPIHHT